jgi:hypothetical protein
MALTRFYLRAKTLILAHSGNYFSHTQALHISDKAQEKGEIISVPEIIPP